MTPNENKKAYIAPSAEVLGLSLGDWAEGSFENQLPEIEL